jgi:hypothetical protein
MNPPEKRSVLETALILAFNAGWHCDKNVGIERAREKTVDHILMMIEHFDPGDLAHTAKDVL